MNLETLLLVTGGVVPLLLLGAAVLFQRSRRSLRTRLAVLFVALALVPSFFTLVVLWRELVPRTRVQVSEGMEHSMRSALDLARRVLASRHAIAQDLAREMDDEIPIGGPVDEPGRGLARLRYQPATRRLLEVRGTWDTTQAARFLGDPEVDWPSGPTPPKLIRAPDSSHVVIGVSSVLDSKSNEAEHVLVVLPVPEDEARAILAAVEGFRQSQRLGLLEELKLQTAGRLMGGLALVYVLLAVLLAAFLARTLTRPIDRLQQAFEAVTRGELGHQVEGGPAGESELGRLTQGFNRMSRELQQSKEDLVRAARLGAWQDVARRLAHEIKNPLTPITLSIHRIRRRTQEEDTVVRECLDTILEETSHLERLANEFSMFARLPKPVLRSIEPAPILQQVLDLYSAHTGVQLHARLDGIPKLRADQDQLRQIFTNLVKNAVEAMPKGGTIEVQWERQDGHVVFTFLDSGTGFHPEALQHLFDPTFTTKPNGSGLGLAIVHRIVEDHHGDIAAGNREHQGAWVRLRLQEAEA